MANPQKELTRRGDDLLSSLMYVDEEGVRSRGFRSWKDIAATMNEQAAGYGLGLDPRYAAVTIQTRWVEVL